MESLGQMRSPHKALMEACSTFLVHECSEFVMVPCECTGGLPGIFALVFFGWLLLPHGTEFSSENHWHTTQNVTKVAAFTAAHHHHVHSGRIPRAERLCSFSRRTDHNSLD